MPNTYPAWRKVTFNLPEDIYLKLGEQAKSVLLGRTDYIRSIVAAAVTRPNQAPTVKDISDPIDFTTWRLG